MKTHVEGQRSEYYSQLLLFLLPLELLVPSVFSCQRRMLFFKDKAKEKHFCLHFILFFSSLPFCIESPFANCFYNLPSFKPVLSKFWKPGVIISTIFRNHWKIPWKICHLPNSKTKLILEQTLCCRILKMKRIHSLQNTCVFSIPLKCLKNIKILKIYKKWIFYKYDSIN